MATSIVELDRWMATPKEDEHLEFKAARNSFDRVDLYRYCVALANEGGGRLILGVSDAKPRRVVGSLAFSDIGEIAKSILDHVHFRVDVEEVTHPDGRVVVFHVPSRPSGTAYSLDGSYWMRSKDRLVAMTDDCLRRIHDEGRPDWELRTAKSNCSAEDVVRLLDVQACFDMMSLPFPTTREAVLERLSGWSLVRHASDESWAVTNLGAILFAKRLDDFEDLRRKAARVVVYGGPAKFSPTVRDETFPRGYGAGFKDLVGFVNSQLPQNEIIGQALRAERRMFPEIAVRELAANALVHQDFQETGTGVLIEVFSDRLEMSSPGKPFIPLERFIDGYRSRNEKLAEFLRWLHICEEKGSGIDKVINAVEIFQLPPPDFRATDRLTVSILFAHKDFESMDRDERVRACYQHCVLCWCTNKAMTNQSLRDRFGLHTRSTPVVSNIISSAVQVGLVKPANPERRSKKYARYIPAWA